MKPGSIALLSTVIGFAAGYVAAQWAERQPSIPAPPAAVGAEVKSAISTSGNRTAEANSEALEELKGEIEAFRKRMEPLKERFREKFAAILTPEQRKRLESLRGKQPESTQPKLGEPGWAPTGIIFITATTERIAESAGLSAEQKEAVRKLLLEQRELFLALTDEYPPPSLRIHPALPTPTPAP